MLQFQVMLQRMDLPLVYGGHTGTFTGKGKRLAGTSAYQQVYRIQLAHVYLCDITELYRVRKIQLGLPDSVFVDFGSIILFRLDAKPFQGNLSAAHSVK